MLLQREDVCAALRNAYSIPIYLCSEKGIERFDNFSSGNIPVVRHQTFKAGPLPSPEMERISLALSILSTEMRHFEECNTFPNGTQRSGVDPVREEGQRLLCKGEREIGVAAHKIREVLEHVSCVALKITIVVSTIIARSADVHLRD
ncbi:hypothetical protein Tcan_13263 [Toxocara canis]|uniref:Uncharacterized protein n=2 Tax=Toxocara canis TaxID=6265 RepID=A0A0B2VVR6_TOXCA|nr:hypothetical protein Tcan_13263 [Toxocara canis]VDM37665.1 unnamed protein product [Toxocara canis]